MDTQSIKVLPAQLQALRHVLLTDGGRGFLEFFDDFAERHELGLALYMVYDLVLDPNSPRVDQSIVDPVQRLHTAMKIDDSCVEDLQNQKLA